MPAQSHSAYGPMDHHMPLAKDSGDQKKLSAEKGVRFSKTLPGNNKLTPTELAAGDRGTEKKQKKADLAKDAEIISKAKKRFVQARTVESDNRKEGVEDLKFLNGEQWSQADASARAADGRPCITENRLPTLANQITNDQRQNRPSICVSPMGDKSSKKDAKILRGMIRAIERDSSADVAYDTGFQSAVHNGWGYWRIMTEYESDKSFDKVIVVKPIANPMNVYLDPNRTPFGLDAKWGFVTEMLPKEDFKREYPDAAETPWGETGIGDSDKEWITDNEIRVAEYYYFEHDERELVMMDNGHQGWEDELADELKDAIADGRIEVLSRRTVQVQKLKWCKHTAIEILDKRDCDGQYIPIIECDGTVLNINGKVIKKGIIRDAKGPQKMANYYSPLSLNTPLPTPTGWTTMGDVSQGDVLIDDRGFPTLVIGTSPVYINRDCYKVTFDDGSEIVADAQHPWMVLEKGKRTSAGTPRIERKVTTIDLSVESHVIATPGAMELPDIDLPIHPYLLGAWLGDGSRYEPSLCAGDKDMQNLREILQGFGHNLSDVHYSGERVGWFTVYGVRKHFSALGLLKNKHIPAQYLRASREQREMLLQGLMDTDGAIAVGNNQCAFVNTNPDMLHGFAELVRSLGIKAVSCQVAGGARMFPGGNICETQESTKFSFTAGVDIKIFRLDRKNDIQQMERREHPYRTKVFRIKSVVSVPSVPVKCVAIDSPSHLFLAGEGMVPTHNTLETENVALQPKAPWIMEEGQVEGHEAKWQAANRKSFSYLLYKGTSINGKPAPAPQRQPFQGPPAAILAAKQGTIEALKAVTGIRFDATMSERMQDESGRAIRELNRNANLGAYHYIDNFGRALRNTGIVMVDLIPVVYDTRRIVAILDETGAEDRVMINPHMTQAHGEVIGQTPDSSQPAKIKMFNPKVGRYQVTVTIGPSHATKRIEATESQMDFMRVNPQLAPMIADLVAKNSDWDGADEIAARLAKSIPPNMLQPNKDDMNPQVQSLIQGLQQQVQQQTMQMQQMMKELTDREKDRQVMRDQIQSKHEAELTKIAAHFTEEMEKVAQKKEAVMHGTIGRQLSEVSKAVQEFQGMFQKQLPAATPGMQQTVPAGSQG